MAVKLNDLNPNNQTERKPAKYSEEAVELMRAISFRETHTGESVKKPFDVFNVLVEELGFQRSQEADRRALAKEFVTAVRRQLIAKKRRSPSYDEVLEVMRQLGYERSDASAT